MSQTSTALANLNDEDFVFPSLTNHFLIAMPSLQEDLFEKSVIFLCEHSPLGAMGLVINKPADLTLQELFGKIDLNLSRPEYQNQPVMQGGPVNSERGFVLHERMSARGARPDAGMREPATFAQMPAYTATVFANDELEVTASKDVLEAIADGAGPKRILMTLGYASWGAGQLESELFENIWLTAPANSHLIFDTPFDQRYPAALALLGVTEMDLSATAGHA